MGLSIRGVATIYSAASLAAATKTALANSAEINMRGTNGAILTCEGYYHPAAAAGLVIHILTSPNNELNGAHTAAPNAVLTAAGNLFIAGSLVGLVIVNYSDYVITGTAATYMTGVITANTANTVTCAGGFAGGTNNFWTPADIFGIIGANYDTINFQTFTPTFAAGTWIRESVALSNINMGYIKALVENTDAAQAASLVKLTITRASD